MGHPKHLLNMQYRMHPFISCFPNSKFYFNDILDAPNVREKCYEKQYLPGPMFGPYSFINVLDGREELDDVGHSRRNMVEVAIVLKLVMSLHKGMNSKFNFPITTSLWNFSHLIYRQAFLFSLKPMLLSYF